MTSGVINIYKEKGYTSFRVVALIRKLTGERKVGHTGTLDPDAEGVLPVCIGKATKLAGRLTDTDKTYRAVMTLGVQTDTQDISGRIIESMSPEDIRSRVNPEQIISAIRGFVGEIYQIPPMYSALKVDGVKLVNAARAGKEIKREPRRVIIHDITRISVDMERLEVSFTTDCSKGTYIRTLCEDIGKSLGISACMKSLVRTRAAGLSAEEGITPEEAIEFARQGRLQEYIISIERFLTEYPSLFVNDGAIARLESGNHLYETDFEDFDMPKGIEGGKGVAGEPGTYRIYDCRGIFFALYSYNCRERRYKCEQMFK
ncbi:MAG: tRNA pseudouridine(55) synthase TruB [Lachnospiraceae bacterium]|jgi:tRNA pseudouridine55 synthase